jgi:hypothetical protein
MMTKAAKTLRKSIRKKDGACFKTDRSYLDLVLPIKEASNGFELASSFLVLATLSAVPGFGTLAAFFMR